MAGKIDLNNGVAVIESKKHSVRAMLNGSETMFSASDVLSACGIKYPLRWISRNRNTNPESFPGVKLPFPMMTECGRREIMMVFVKAEDAKKMVDLTANNGETKNWLLKEVLTYRIPAEPPELPVAEEEPEIKKEEVPRAGRLYATDLNRRIDSLLFELLEIKKMTAAEFELHG